MALWSNTDAENSKPKFLTAAEKALTFGVDVAEQAAETSQGTGPTHAGWVLRTEGTGQRAGRVFQETLVAMGSMTGDLEDVVMQDLNIIIGTQPADAETTAPGSAEFTVVATTVPTGGSLTYQWQVSTNGGTNYNNITVANEPNLTGYDTDTLTMANTTGADGYMFRCQISATGATTVTSSAATLTVLAGD